MCVDVDRLHKSAVHSILSGRGQAGVEPLVVVVHGHGEDLLGRLLPHDVLVQVGVDLEERERLSSIVWSGH